MYTIAAVALLLALLISFLGIWWRMPIFGRKRWIAALVLIGALVIGVPLTDSLRTPEIDAELEAIQADGRGSYSDVYDNPESYLTLTHSLDRTFNRGVISGTITNAAPYSIGNAKLRCDVVAETGKRIDQHTKSILKLVPANGRADFADVDIGYVDPQAAGVACTIVDADIMGGSAEAAAS